MAIIKFGQKVESVMARQYGKVIKGGNFLKPRKWEDWQEGDFVEGEYVRAEEKDLYGKPIYELKIDPKQGGKVAFSDMKQDPTKNGIFPMYSNGALDFQMQEASYGDFIKVTYGGMAVTSKGKFKGKPCHSIEVEIDGYVADEEGAAVGAEDNGLGLLGE